MIAEDPTKFKDLVQESLRRQVAAINSLSDVGKYCTQSQIGWGIYNNNFIHRYELHTNYQKFNTI